MQNNGVDAARSSSPLAASESATRALEVKVGDDRFQSSRPDEAGGASQVSVGPRGEAGNDLRAGAAVEKRPARTWRLRPTLMLCDAVGLLGAFVLTRLALHGRPEGDLSMGQEAVLLLAGVPIWILAASVSGLYESDRERPSHSMVDELKSVFNAVTAGTWIVFSAVQLSGIAEPSVSTAVAFWALATVLLTVNRAVVRSAARRTDAYVENTVIVGAGDVGQLIGRKLLQHPEYGFNLVGFVDAQPKDRRADLEGIPLLGEPSELNALIDRHGIKRVMIAFSKDGHDQLLDTIRAMSGRDVRIDIVPRLFEAVGPTFDTRTVGGVPLIELRRNSVGASSLLMKRAMDIVLSAIMLIVTAPLFAVVALLIKRDSTGPVFFRQTRLGQGMREFQMLKFRTMAVETDPTSHRQYIREIMDPNALPQPNRLYKLERSDAVTGVGSWLRRSSLDELPQLINVLRGEMSLVGPRPCIGYELELFEPHHFDRFLLPAGCTGLWQVTARARSTFREALELDVAYVRNWSLGLDVRLLLRTPLLLLRRTGTT